MCGFMNISGRCPDAGGVKLSESTRKEIALLLDESSQETRAGRFTSQGVYK